MLSNHEIQLRIVRNGNYKKYPIFGVPANAPYIRPHTYLDGSLLTNVTFKMAPSVGEFIITYIICFVHFVLVRDYSLLPTFYVNLNY